MKRSTAILVFVMVALLGIIPASITLMQNDALELHQRINHYNGPRADIFFHYATNLADGITVVLVALGLLFFSTWRSFLMVALSCTISSIITQLLKHNLWAENLRPAMYKDHWPDFHWVDGVVLHSYNSFPSGHSTAAFSLLLALTVIVGKKKWAFAFALLAMLLGFSRVYLSQHFLLDVVAGALIGIITGCLVSWFLYLRNSSLPLWFDKRPFQNSGIGYKKH